MRRKICSGILLCLGCFDNATSLLHGYTTPNTRGKIPIQISMSIRSDTEQVPLRKGSTVALVTPMHPNGDLDLQSLRGLLRYHVMSGTDGLCILGTTGEATTLSMEERESVLKVAVEEVKGKIPILAGTGTIDPKHVKEQTMQAMDIGCDAALIVTPYYVKPPQRGLVKHFVEMADIGLPVILYNVPGRTGVNLLPQSVALCACEHENIVGLKDATGDLDNVARLREALDASGYRKDFLLYSGDDATSAKFVLRGGDGCISVSANVAAKNLHEIMMAALEGDEEKVKLLNDPLMKLHDNLFVESNPIPAKWATHRLGLMEHGGIRSPMVEMDEQYVPLMEETLRSAGLLKVESIAD
mmetsp:Transcript_8880/g.13069  ORF Transcript_8880/g.13069 Transcript_8880/m.13069 type:complete len:356 (+) Transcript_8880:96-1163(+)